MQETEHGTILVVEDDAELRFILAAQLGAHGFEVFEAGDGPTGIELAKQHLPDVVIMDIGLPRMDGITATETLRADGRTADIPVIMLTARSGSADVVRRLNAGAQEYLHKPFDVAELMARVRTVHRLAVAKRRIDRLNSRLEAEVDEKTHRLQILYEYMRDLNHAETVDAVVDLLADAARKATSARRVAMFLVSLARGDLRCVRTIGVDEEALEPLRQDAAALVDGGVFTLCSTTLAAKAPAPSGTPDVSSCGASSGFLSVPLMCASFEDRSEILGVLHVAGQGPHAFSDDDIECLRSLADAAAIAFENIRRQSRLEQSVRVLLRTVGHLAEYRDEETTRHLERVAKMAKMLAKELRKSSPYAPEISNEFIESIGLAAPLHDIGKVGIPDEILTKPGRLTNEEFQIMKSHAEIGHRVLSQAIDLSRPVPLLRMCVDIAHCHHERYDGHGYPRRLKAMEIPLAARIVALVDAYDAITSKRRYKEPASHDEAVRLIEADAGKHFDPEIVRAFRNCEAEFDAIRTRYSEEDVPVAVAR